MNSFATWIFEILLFHIEAVRKDADKIIIDNLAIQKSSKQAKVDQFTWLHSNQM